MKKREIYVGETLVDLSDLEDVALKISPNPEFVRVQDICDDPLLDHVLSQFRWLMREGVVASKDNMTMIEVNQLTVVVGRMIDAIEDAIDRRRLAR